MREFNIIVIFMIFLQDSVYSKVILKFNLHSFMRLKCIFHRYMLLKITLILFLYFQHKLNFFKFIFSFIIFRSQKMKKIKKLKILILLLFVHHAQSAIEDKPRISTSSGTIYHFLVLTGPSLAHGPGTVI